MTTADIEGTWRATDVAADASEGFSDAVLTVTGDEFTLTVGCNDLGGLITSSESTITLTGRSTTEIGGCPAGEEILWEAFDAGVVATPADQDRLVLELPDGMLHLQRSRR